MDRQKEIIWRDLKSTMAIFGVGRATVERIALKADAKRKIGRRALYCVARMSEWLEAEGGDDDDR